MSATGQLISLNQLRNRKNLQSWCIINCYDWVHVEGLFLSKKPSLLNIIPNTCAFLTVFHA